MKTNVFLLAALLFVGVTAKPGARIIGGINALAGQFPFAAAIQVQTANNRHFCGGALVAQQWVLTSANCITNATLITIQLGSNTLTEDDPNRVTVATSDYLIHPDFNPEIFHADIGMIKLRMKVTNTEYLSPSSILIGNITEGRKARILGWGQTSDSIAELSEHLQYAETTILSTAECQAIYGSQMTEDIACIIGNYNEGTCTGDNGGPLLAFFNNGYHMAGIASFISANGCESSNPSGYTKANTYWPWIRALFDQ